MPIATWRDEYSVNVEEIDKQHQKLLELVNNLHTAVETHSEKEALKDLLTELADFTRLHFATEEQLMKQYDYPGFAKHHKEHKLLLRYLTEVLEGVSNGKNLIFYADYDVSTDWALTHISESDSSLGAFLNSKGVF